MKNLSESTQTPAQKTVILTYLLNRLSRLVGKDKAHEYYERVKKEGSKHLVNSYEFIRQALEREISINK